MVGVIPLEIPMLAGQGAISTVMLYISHGAIWILATVAIQFLINGAYDILALPTHHSLLYTSLILSVLQLFLWYFYLALQQGVG